MRLIDADALPRHGQRGGLVHWQDIENAPTVDAEPVSRGEWIEREISHSFVVGELQSARCSNCKKYHTTLYMYYFNHFNYCPWCGARMEGDGE